MTPPSFPALWKQRKGTGNSSPEKERLEGNRRPRKSEDSGFSQPALRVNPASPWLAQPLSATCMCMDTHKFRLSKLDICFKNRVKCVHEVDGK